ncbi:MAG: biopolymer transporter ExbB [Campylobacter sp.]|nr:biopolymer transporter ExbB [Campylobacter sp.]
MRNLLLLFLTLFMTACSYKPLDIIFGNDKGTVQEIDEQEYESKLEILKEFDLDEYVGTKTAYDCSSFVSLVNKKHDNRFYEEDDVANFYDRSGRKSKAIYNLYADSGRIVFDDPNAGDLIFFSDTFSKKSRWKNDSENITHVGIVTKVYPDESVEFVHYANKIIKVGYMNLNKKNTFKGKNKIENSYIVDCKSFNIDCLSSSHFAGYGRVK